MQYKTFKLPYHVWKKLKVAAAQQGVSMIGFIDALLDYWNEKK